jgi:uncharacterized membrane protein YkoI
MRRLLTPILTVMMMVFCASWAGASTAFGHERDKNREMTDGDRARGALERGEVLPLEQVMARLEGHIRGEISGIELEKEHGVWVYEFKVISPHGQMVEVHIDAKTGKLIEKKGGE